MCLKRAIVNRLHAPHRKLPLKVVGSLRDSALNVRNVNFASSLNIKLGNLDIDIIDKLIDRSSCI